MPADRGRQGRKPAPPKRTAPRTPNSVPLRQRIAYLIASTCLIAYGGFGLYANDLYVPGRRGIGTHLHDEPALLMVGALLCGVLIMLSIVVDHYDRRDNEFRYRQFARRLKVLGLSLFGVSLVWHLASRLAN